MLNLLELLVNAQVIGCLCIHLVKVADEAPLHTSNWGIGCHYHLLPSAESFHVCQCTNSLSRAATKPAMNMPVADLLYKVQRVRYLNDVAITFVAKHYDANPLYQALPFQKSPVNRQGIVGHFHMLMNCHHHQPSQVLLDASPQHSLPEHCRHSWIICPCSTWQHMLADPIVIIVRSLVHDLLACPSNAEDGCNIYVRL